MESKYKPKVGQYYFRSASNGRKYKWTIFQMTPDGESAPIACYDKAAEAKSKVYKLNGWSK